VIFKEPCPERKEMAKPSLKLLDRLTAREKSRLKKIRECLSVWAKEEDIEELVIVGRCRGGAMHFQTPIGLSDEFWWIGALENIKSKLNSRLNDGSYETEDGEDHP
jgi:hypothetical protein